MSNSLNYVYLNSYKTLKGAQQNQLSISYELAGKPLGTHQTVVVFHALTGNSNCHSLKDGWFNSQIGYNKVIDLNKFTVISFNLLGNGYDGNIVTNYEDFVAHDFAKIIHLALNQMKVNKIDYLIGPSLGGGIGWELITLAPKLVTKFISIASNYQSTRWVKSICHIQENIVLNSNKPLEDARKMAMLFYRNPESIEQKFDTNEDAVSWLKYHGVTLSKRFLKEAYLMMNQALGSINYQNNVRIKLSKVKTEIVQIGINSDLLFTTKQQKETRQLLENLGITNSYHEIDSIHGHDAFLIEHKQVANLMKKHVL